MHESACSILSILTEIIAFITVAVDSFFKVPRRILSPGCQEAEMLAFPLFPASPSF